MSDTPEETRAGKGKKPTSPEHDFDKSKPDVVAKDPAFADWLEKLFYEEPADAHYPEKLEVRVGKGKDLEIYGPLVLTVPFAPKVATEAGAKLMPGERKPTKERIVHISNDILYRIQKECDEARKARVFVIWVWQLSTNTEPIDRWIKRCEPQGKHVRPVDGNGDLSTDDEPVSIQERHSVQILHHQESMVGLVGHAWENIIDRDDRTIERLLARILHLETLLERKNEEIERMRSNEIDREERRMWAKLKIESAEKAINMGTQLLPPIFHGLTTKNGAIQNGAIIETGETIAIKNFFAAMTQPQTHTVVGIYKDEPPYDQVKAGILTFEQSKLLYDVSACRIHSDALDKLMPEGEMEISPAQGMALLQCLGTQIVALQILFDARQRRQQQKNNNPTK